jgi:leucyl/phenylalanyl-tRNA--protein transferase
MLFEKGVRLIDCQQHTSHLESMGAEDISRVEFLAMLRKFNH